MSPTICTVVAKNYLSFARVLASSFVKHHPDGRCYVLIIDDIKGYVRKEAEPFEIVTIDDLPIPQPAAFSFKYDVTELATAVKPYFFQYLFELFPNQPLLFLDPDILILHPLDALFDGFGDDAILLTPHTERDYPDDGLQPTEGAILKAGLFNLGFIGMKDRASTSDFLAWWESKVFNKCVIDPAHGYFVDQRFLDLALMLFKNIRVLHSPGYNVAWWNLHYRTVTRAGSCWKCNDEPLVFYHFSGYKPEAPDRIAKHQTRFRLTELSDLHALFSEYRELLLAQGYSETTRWPYTHDCFTDGTKIPPFVRKIYRDTPSLQSKYPQPFESDLLRVLARSDHVRTGVRTRMQAVERVTIDRVRATVRARLVGPRSLQRV